MLVQQIVLFVIFSLSTLVAQSQSFEELIMGSNKIINNTVPKDENGVLNGKGVIFWASGDVYEGNLTDGLFQGYGEFTWFSGVKYKGNWVRDMKEGYGELIWSNGQSYTGNWKANKMHGTGKLTLPDGQSSKVEYEDGVWVKWLE